MKKRTPFLTALTLTAALIATGCSSNVAIEKPLSDLAAYENQKLDWATCYEDFECTDLRVRLSPEVSQALHIAQCFVSNSVVRLFEQLDGAPFLVVILVTSRVGDVRCRCVKHLATAKLKLPFALVVRLIPRACDSCERLMRLVLRPNVS